MSTDSNETGRLPTLEGIQSVDSGRGNFHFHERDNQSLGKSGEAVSPLEGQKSAGGVEITPLPRREDDEVCFSFATVCLLMSNAQQIRAISSELESRFQEDFGDVGMLTRSWGD